MEVGERPGLIHSDTLSLEAELPEALIPPRCRCPPAPSPVRPSAPLTSLLLVNIA